MNSNLSRLLAGVDRHFQVDGNFDAARKEYEAGQFALGMLNLNETIGALQFKQVVNGKTEERTQPLLPGQMIKLDANHLRLPAELGGHSLLAEIKKQCTQHSITFDETKFTSVKLRPVVTPLIGKQESKDDLAKAEYYPIYRTQTEKCVLIICFSENGSTGVRVDYVKVSSGSSECANRKGLGDRKNKTLQATEIPNRAAKELFDSNPGAFEYLQKDGAIIAIVELKDKQIYSNPSYDSYHNYKGGSDGYRGGSMTRGGGAASKSADSVNTYSVTEQGSHATHDLRTVYVNPQEVESINVFAFSTVVVNPKNLSDPNQLAQNTKNAMTVRLSELQDVYNQLMSFDSFKDTIDEELKRFNVRCNPSDILEHSLLKMFGVDCMPTECVTTSQRDGTETYVKVFIQGLASEHITKLNKNLPKQVEYKAIDVLNYGNGMGVRYQCSIKMPFSYVLEQKAAICDQAKVILTDKRNLSAYLAYTSVCGNNSDNRAKVPILQQETVFSWFERMLPQEESIVSENVLPSRRKVSHLLKDSGLVEFVIARMFGYQHAPFSILLPTAGVGYVGAAADTHFKLQISYGEASSIVEKINKEYGVGTASIEGQVESAVTIVIANWVLMDDAFRKAFKTKLDEVSKDFVCFELFQARAGVSMASTRCMVAFRELIQKYEAQATAQTASSSILGVLVNAMKEFVKELSSATRTLQKADELGDTVRRKMSFFQGMLPKDDEQKFRETDKKVIVDSLVSLGLRKKSSV